MNKPITVHELKFFCNTYNGKLLKKGHRSTYKFGKYVIEIYPHSGLFVNTHTTEVGYGYEELLAHLKSLEKTTNEIDIKKLNKRIKALQASYRLLSKKLNNLINNTPPF